MLELVNDILDVVAIEAGKRELLIDEIAPAGILKDSVAKFETALTERRIQLRQDIPEDLPSLHADSRALVQIVFNLMSNAIRFTEPGGSVEVSASTSQDDLVILIKDSGVGISKRLLEKITEPFTQADPDPHRAKEGTGLGLSIVSSLVEAHGGELEIKSEVGVGTAVTVMLPLHRDQPTCAPQRATD